MSVREPETMPPARQHAGRVVRRAEEPGPCLVLSELNPLTVIDHLDGDGHPIHVLTFGGVREPCPKCATGHLKLVLRQSAVRVAHLFCPDCASCFDAHYPNGSPALTI